MRTAVIGIGSNSLRMLVADFGKGNRPLVQVRREREGLRVFAALSCEKDGTISKDMIEQSTMAIKRMYLMAVKDGAEQIFLFATSATRDCKNQAEFAERIKAETGLTLQILSGEEEAVLSYIGATEGRDGAMIDIGGGSTEFALGQKGQILFAHSFQLGAVRLFQNVPILSQNDIPKALNYAKNILMPLQADISAQLKAQHYTSVFGVGGTFTSLSALVQNIPWNNYTKIHHFVVPKEAVYQKMLLLAKMPLSKRHALISMQPARADIIVNGIAVLYACMDVFGIDRVIVSGKGNLEGFLIQHYLNQ